MFQLRHLVILSDIPDVSGRLTKDGCGQSLSVRGETECFNLRVWIATFRPTPDPESLTRLHIPDRYPNQIAVTSSSRQKFSIR